VTAALANNRDVRAVVLQRGSGVQVNPDVLSFHGSFPCSGSGRVRYPEC
jgi:hypothetical protein